MSEITALISLLDDPDECVYHQVKDKIISLGGNVIPELEGAFETNFDQLVQKRTLDLIHEIQFKDTLNSLLTWKKNGSKSILEGAIIIAKYQYPDLRSDKIIKQIEKITNDIWLELNDSQTALEKIKTVNHILFDIHTFSGNTQSFHAPQNSFINNVLESKKGNPLLMSILYLSVTQSLGLPLFGVNLPEHFIIAYLDENNTPHQTNVKKILFYINPFSRGTVFGKIEIDNFLKQLNLKEDNHYYQPCSNIEMIKRLLRNLAYSFEKTGYKDKVNEVTHLLSNLN